jgi:hypothetical protein
MARKPNKDNNGATLGLEVKPRLAVDALRNNLDVAERQYTHRWN